MMSDFKTRLRPEKEKLDAKLQKLNAFFETKKYAALDYELQVLLNIQAKAMDTYLQCLKERLVIRPSYRPAITS